MTQAKKAIYANIFCPTLHYPAIDYLLHIKSLLKKGDKLYLCFWDQETYPFQRLGDYVSSNQTYDQKVKKVVRDISIFLSAHHVNHEIVYMSDAMNRIIQDEHLNDLLFQILSKISIGHLEHAYSKIKYTDLRTVTISKIIYMVADYIIGSHFTKLFPELSSIPVTDFYSGERFKAVISKIEEVITEKGLRVQHPNMIYAKPIPILNYRSGNWISITMSKNEVEREIRKQYEDKVETDQVKMILKLLTKMLDDDDFVLYKDGESQKSNIQSVITQLPKLSKEDQIKTLTENMYAYMTKAKSFLEDGKEKEFRKINYIRDPAKLKDILNILSPTKMEILKLCDGTNTIPQIIEKSPMKESSTRSYLSRLKTQNIITGDTQPKRKVDEILISFN